MKRFALLGLAGLLGAAALGTAIYVAFERLSGPTVLTIATGPQEATSSQIMAAASKLMSRHSGLRLELLPTTGPAESAAALDSGKADLAVARSDIGLPVEGQSVAILRRDTVLFVAAPQTGIASLADLSGRRVGILPATAANESLLDLVLHQYDVPAISVTKVLMHPGDVEASVRDNQIDVLMLVGPAGGPLASRVIGDFTRAIPNPIFLPVGEAPAMAQRSPSLETATIVQGTFGASRPRGDLTTLALTERLMARASLADETVAELAREFYEMRPQLAKTVPDASRIEAPETDRGAQFAVHPGAEAYLDNDEQTFFDKYGDWIYILAMIGGVIASGLAAVAARWKSRSAEQGLRLEHLLDVLRRARDADSRDLLDRLELEADEILAEALASASRQALDPQRLSAFSLALDQVRQAISERRRLLARSAGPSAVISSPVIRAVSERG
jgi:TRAP transporter TAXI family solute receptor